MENPDLRDTISRVDVAPAQEQFDSLRHQVNSVLILVIVLSCAFNVYLWRQLKYLRTDLSAFRPQATQLIADYERISEPALRDFATKLTDFGKSPRSDETFAAILKKYNLASIAAGTNPAPASTAPSTSAPAQKAGK